MKKALKQVEKTILANDAWAYVAVILCFSLARAVSVSSPGWADYLRHLLLLSLLYFPLLVFQAYKPTLKAHLSRKKFLATWVSVFVIYLGLVTWAAEYWLAGSGVAYGAGFFVKMGLGFILLEAVLAAGSFTKQFTPKASWVKRISFDHAILFTLFLIAMLFGAMATSDIDLFYSRQLIRWTLKPAIVLQHFGTFVSITLQLFSAYLTIYFLYYLNRSVLIPKLLRQKGILLYLLGLLGSVALLYPLLAQLILMLPLSQNVVPLIPSENYQAFDTENGEAALAIMVLSIPLVLVMQWLRQNNQIVTLQKQQAQTELNLLKQQLDPHFFFNTLNNLYSLSRRKSDQTPEVILQLSEMMRYLIYKGKEEKAPLAQEIKYMEDYMQLQLIRLHKKVEVRFEKNIADPDLAIPPLLLIIFVENAFKHGIEPAGNAGFLHLSLVGDARRLTFCCQNSFEARENREEGIGLQNLKRRLELLFPDNHTLILSEKDHVYEATLTLHLS